MKIASALIALFMTLVVFCGVAASFLGFLSWNTATQRWVFLASASVALLLWIRALVIWHRTRGARH